MFRYVCSFFIFFVLSGFTNGPFALSLKDVHPTMDKMFAYHVENKEFSPLVVKRSFKIFIEEFDSDRIYLLKEEVEPYLSLTPKQINKIISDFSHNSFSEYRNLNGMIERAILRNQRIWREQAKRLIREGPKELNRPVSKAYASYSSSEIDLQERIYSRLILQINAHLKSRNEGEITPELMEQVLNFRAKKKHSLESKYLDSGEHYLTLHMLKAMAKSLDAHTGYYSPREAHEIRTALKKEFSGVGVVLREDFDGVYITDVIQGGPAHKSGKIEMGDLLVAVNNRRLEEITYEQLLETMKGKAGSKITLGVNRDQVTAHVDLIREKITMDDERLSFSYVPHGDGIIGLIDVPGFYDNGGQVSLDHDLREALRSLKGEGKLLGIVMDFRENSGGFLSQAVKVSSIFMDGGLIVISKYADGEVSYQRNINGRKYYDGPLVILTSKASASAAEIVAGALQDYGVALIVGDERSYGKGSMQYQTITDEKAKAFFKVTVGRYYTASGRSPQVQGVQADIVVPTIFFPYNIGERYLEYPLSNDHLSGDVFHSLMNIKQGSYHDVVRFTVPYLKPRESEWRQMLPKLAENSQQRLDKDKNFQLFLKLGNGYRPKKENYGISDLQMKESVEIIKDMIEIDAAKKSLAVN